MPPPAPLLNNQDKIQLLQLGKAMAEQGVVYRREVQGGLLKAILADSQDQNAAQSGVVNHPQTAMTTEEFRDYLKFMGGKIKVAAKVIEEDHKNPHGKEIALGAYKTAEFVRALAEQKEREVDLKQQMQLEIQRQLVNHDKEQEKSRDERSKQEGFSLGSTIGGICDEMVKMLGGDFNASPLAKIPPEIMHGLQDCKQEGGISSHKNTPASALPPREFSMDLPKHSGG